MEATRSKLSLRALAMALALSAPLVVAPAGTASPAAAEASVRPAQRADLEGDFTARIARLRRQEGVRGLASQRELDDIARRWAERMADEGRISHNDHLADELPPGWRSYGENVGQGPDVASIFAAFVESPPHHHNLSDPEFTHVGVGVAVADGTLFTSHVFVATG